MSDSAVGVTCAESEQVELADGPPTRPVVLFLPGTMCPPQVFTDVARLVGCRVVGLGWLEGLGSYDLDSVARRVLAVADRLAPVVIVGHSTGAAIAVITAAEDARRDQHSVVGLVLANSGANTRGLRDISSILDRIREEWGPPFWRDFALRCVHREIPETKFQQLIEYPVRLDPTAVIEALQSQRETDLLPTLERIAVPCTVVHGRFDPARPVEHAREMADTLPDAELVVVDSGHTSCLELPEVFAATTTAVIERTARA